MDFLDLQDKMILIFGVANKRSVAYHVARVLEEAGARVIYSVRSPDRKDSLAKLLCDRDVYVCDVEHVGQITNLVEQVREKHPTLHGVVHSIAFANSLTLPLGTRRPVFPS